MRLMLCRNRRLPAARCWIALAGILPAAPSPAQDPQGSQFDELIDAVPLERESPQYPSGALALGREGWVLVSFMVAENGAVIEPMVEESTGDRTFERAALNAVEDWRYEPARLNGEPIAQGRTEVWIQFQLQGANQGASRNFISAYQEAAAQLAANDLAATAATLSRIETTIKSNLYEEALYWWLRSIYLEAADPANRADIKMSVRRSIGHEEYFLPPEMLVTAIRRLYVMQFQDGELANALETFELLETAEPAKTAAAHDAVSRELSGHVREIRALVAGSDVLASTAEVQDNDYWFQKLLRRAFSVEQIEGELERLDLRCPQRAAKYDSIVEGEVRAVPDGWEGCSVYIKGEPGTTFVLYEYAAAGD